MAHKKEDLIKESLIAIKKYKLFFIEDVIAYISCSKSTFYNQKLHELDSIKEALTKNRIEIKVSMRNKWYNSQSATLQIALMKLISSDDEAHRLNGSRQEIKHNADIKVGKISNEARQKIDDILNDEY